jgi:hypothetical protein
MAVDVVDDRKVAIVVTLKQAEQLLARELKDIAEVEQ